MRSLGREVFLTRVLWVHTYNVEFSTETGNSLIFKVFKVVNFPPGLPLPGWAETRQWAYNTQRPLYKDGDTSPSLVVTGSLGLIDRSCRDREIGVSSVGSTLAAAWG